jgi:hypothetical protein
MDISTIPQQIRAINAYIFALLVLKIIHFASPVENSLGIQKLAKTNAAAWMATLRKLQGTHAIYATHYA